MNAWKTIAAILIAVLSGSTISGILVNLVNKSDVENALLVVISGVSFPIAALASFWWVRRGNPTLGHLIFKGCLLGASEWAITIASIRIHQWRSLNVLASSGLTELELKSETIRVATAADLDNLVAFFSLGLCIVGLLLTRRYRTAVARRAVSSSACGTPSDYEGPNPRQVGAIVAAEVIVGGLIALVVVWCRRSDIGMLAIPLGIALLFPAGTLFVLAIAGLVQGLRLVVARRHRTLAALAVGISIVPLGMALLGTVYTLRSSYEEERVLADRRAEYRRVTPYFQESRRLVRANAVDATKITLLFIDESSASVDSLSVCMNTWDAHGLAEYANEFLVGEPMEVKFPEEPEFARAPYVDVEYDGKRLDHHWDDLVQLER